MAYGVELAAHEVGRGSPEAADAEAIYRVWPGDGVPPGAEGWSWAESTMPIPWSTRQRRLSRNVVIPTLTLFRPAEGTANGSAMIVAPGGAFHFLMIDHEGYDMARWLAGQGITAFVLKYRLGRTPDADAELLDFRNGLHARLRGTAVANDQPPSNPVVNALRIMGEEDGRQAMRFVRANAAHWAIAPDRIGIAGFSAGGAVSVGAAMLHDAQSRPDFAVGVYPAYRAELAVPANPPPLFLTIADDDSQVAPLSSSRLYDAWHRAGGSAELHVFANGEHGFGMSETEDLLSDAWVGLLGNWLRAKGIANRG